MFLSRGWMRLALILNLAGTALLYLSFQATSSTVKIITDPQGDTAICMNGNTVIESSPGGAVGIGAPGCPQLPNAKPIALVTVEKPFFIYLGFAILLLGFLLQLLSIPSPKTLGQMRAEVKQAEKQEKLARKLEQLKSHHDPTMPPSSPVHTDSSAQSVKTHDSK